MSITSGRSEDRTSISPLVRTVLGDVAASSLGRTLIHEHLISDISVYWEPGADPTVAMAEVSLATLRAARLNASAMRDNLRLDGIGLAIKELAPFRTLGGGTIVEVTSRGIGRDVRALAIIARESRLNIIAGCGYYIAASRPPAFDSRSEASLQDELVHELTVGVGALPMRAGVIGEIGVGQFPMLNDERRMLRAAAKAQRRTGAGIVVHPAFGTESAFELVRVLDRAGATMEKVVVAHLDERFRSDIGLFKRLGRAGVRFGFDTFGREGYNPLRGRQHPSDSDRIETIASLWDAGLGGRVTLAQDVCHRHELAAFGGPGYSYVLEVVVPRMVARGISLGMIDEMLVATPAQLLALAS